MSLGNAGRGASDSVLRPTFRQEQFAVQQAVEVVHGIAQMDRHDAVVLLADVPTILTLHSRSLLALLAKAGLVDQPHRVIAGVGSSNALLQAVAQQVFVPAELAEVLLQRPHRHASGVGDRLDALPLQIRQLPIHIRFQMSPCPLVGETVGKVLKIPRQHRLQSAKFRGIHAQSSLACYHGLHYPFWQPYTTAV